MELFEKYITKKIKFKKCLLIINRYNNHINIYFIETCDK